MLLRLSRDALQYGQGKPEITRYVELVGVQVGKCAESDSVLARVVRKLSPLYTEDEFVERHSLHSLL